MHICISLHSFAFLCISLNLSAFLYTFLHFSAFYILRQFDGAYRRPIKAIFFILGEGVVGGAHAVEADVPEDQQDLAGGPFLPAMLEQV